MQGVASRREPKLPAFFQSRCMMRREILRYGWCFSCMKHIVIDRREAMRGVWKTPGIAT